MTYARPDQSDNSLEQQAALLDIMGNASRLHVLTLLTSGEVSVGSLSQKGSISQSALSQHLAKMRAGGLVSTRRDGQTIYYTCASPAIHRILNVLATFFEDDFAHRKKLA